jgi:hypothetical protein
VQQSAVKNYWAITYAMYQESNVYAEAVMRSLLLGGGNRHEHVYRVNRRGPNFLASLFLIYRASILTATCSLSAVTAHLTRTSLDHVLPAT